MKYWTKKLCQDFQHESYLEGVLLLLVSSENWKERRLWSVQTAGIRLAMPLEWGILSHHSAAALSWFQQVYNWRPSEPEKCGL